MNKNIKTSKAEEKRERIIWALYYCLAEMGQEQVSIKEIALKAGLPHGVIHYYFSSKDEIISSLAVAMIDRYSNILSERLKNIDHEYHLSTLIDYIVEVLIFDREVNQVFYNLIQMTFERESLRQAMRTMLDNYRKNVSYLFQKFGAGKASTDISSALVAMTEGFAIQNLVDPDSLKPEIVRTIIEQGVHGILSSVKEYNE